MCGVRDSGSKSLCKHCDGSITTLVSKRHPLLCGVPSTLSSSTSSPSQTQQVQPQEDGQACFGYAELLHHIVLNEQGDDETFQSASQAVDELDLAACGRKGARLFYLYDSSIEVENYFTKWSEYLSLKDADKGKAPSPIALCSTCLFNLSAIIEHATGFMVVSPIRDQQDIQNAQAAAQAQVTLSVGDDSILLYRTSEVELELSSNKRASLSNFGLMSPTAHAAEARATALYKNHRDANAQTRKDLRLQLPKYLFITPPIGRKLLAAGTDAPEHSVRWRLALGEDETSCTKVFTFDAPLNLRLQFLVIGGGHGGTGVLFENSAGKRLNRDFHAKNVVKPLVDAKVSASVIVLDQCLTVSMMMTYAPLLAEGGVMVGTMYSTTARMLNAESWAQVESLIATPYLINRTLRLGLKAFVELFKDLGSDVPYIVGLWHKKKLYFDARMESVQNLAALKKATGVESDNPEIEDLLKHIEQDCVGKGGMEKVTYRVATFPEVLEAVFK